MGRFLLYLQETLEKEEKMREDYAENLQKMFPKGYVIVHIQPNENPAYSWFNPNADEFLDDYVYMLHSIFLDETGDEGDRHDRS